MIELLPESSGNVLGFRLCGMVTSQDFDELLVPALQEAFNRYDIIRVLIEITDFKGKDIEALWEDLDNDRCILSYRTRSCRGGCGLGQMDGNKPGLLLHLSQH
jgi:hypothetical protein